MRMIRSFLPAAALFLGMTMACQTSRAAAVDGPPPVLAGPELDRPLAPAGAAADTAYFAGGCFWGVQAVFQHVTGVIRATSGYAGGHLADPDYYAVTTGRTGHAETVRVIYDPAKVSYGTLLKVFFSVAHNPTEKDRQGPDVGTQYRSAIFTRDAAQATEAKAYIGQLDRAKSFGAPIVTEVTRYTIFYPAEAYHQDYATLHPNDAYILVHDAPKLEDLRTRFKELWTNTKAGS